MSSAQPSCYVECVSCVLEHLNLGHKNVEAAFMEAKILVRMCVTKCGSVDRTTAAATKMCTA